MNRFPELIHSASAAPSTIIHIGAGICGEHDLYEALNPSSIIYIEPNPHLAERARKSHRNAANVKIIERAVASAHGHLELNVTNNWRYSSLLSPMGLIDHYPNVEVSQIITVEAITLSQLCEEECVSDESDNLLVVELQGMENEIFTATSVDTLQKFKWVIVRTSKKELYSSMPSATEKDFWMAFRNAGFTTLAFDEDTPPFSNTICLRNDNAKNYELLKTSEIKLLEKTSILEKENSKQSSEIRDLQSGYEVRLSKAHKKTASQTKKLKAASKSLQSITTEKDALQETVTKLSDSLDARTEELNQANNLLQSVTSEKDALQENVTQLSDSMNARTEELNQANTLLQSVTSEKDVLQENVTQLSDSVDVRTEELNQANTLLQSVTSEKDALQENVTQLSDGVDVRTEELNQANTLLQSVTSEKDALQENVTQLSDSVDVKTEELGKTEEHARCITAEKEVLQDRIAELSGSIDASAIELKDLHELTQSLTREKSEQQQRIADLENRIQEKDSEHFKMQQALRINNKLILKSDTDLRELQLQYRTALQHQEQQHSLLVELKEKLRQASSFYQKLNLQHLVIESGLLEQDDTNDIDARVESDDSY